MLRSLLVVVAVVVALSSASSADAARHTCNGYGYGGYQSPVAAYGISGELTATKAPQVVDGHVAAWLGVGGSAMGPNGEDEWVQAGISGFPDGHSELYLEYVTPALSAPKYVTIAAAAPGETHQIGIVERQPNVWSVQVDGKRVGPAVTLPGSHGAWRPIATTESWDGGTGACNRFAYDFGSLAVATKLGGGWQPFGLVRRLQNAGHTVVARASGFAATLA